MGRRCSLCGGKMSGKRCTECGLDNSINDRNRMRNVRLEHPVSEKRVSVQKKEIDVGKNLVQRNNSKNSHGAKNKKSGKAARIITILCAVIPLLIAFVPDIVKLFSTMGTGTPEAVMEYEYDEYEWVTREIPQEGEGFAGAFAGGVYKVGVHIPEGIYEIQILKGIGGIDVKDDENSIYIYRSMGDEGDVAGYEDIRLYNGAQVRVDSGTIIQFVTENAQPLVQECLENPLKDNYVLDHTVTVGMDGPAPGIYDIRWEKGSGWIEYMMPQWDYSQTIFLNNYYYNGDGTAEQNPDPVYKNVVLPAGMELIVEDEAKFTLIPSEGYYEENIDSYYEEY